MTAANFSKAMKAFARRQPFKPFIIKFASGESLRVDHPESLVFWEGVGVHYGPAKDITILDHDGISRLYDAPVKRKSA